MALAQTLDFVPTKVTVEVVKQVFKKRREATNTSSSGIYLCHYNVLLVPDGTYYDEHHPNSTDQIWILITIIIKTAIEI